MASVGSFQERYGPWALVAGGTDGIGASYARELARRGLSVAIVARREAPLAAIASELQDAHGVEVATIRADLTAPDADARMAQATEGLDVGLYVYNAGSNRTQKRFAELSREEALFTLALNGTGPLLFSQLAAERLRARGGGGLVLMSSLACLAGGAYNTVYAATKAFVTNLAEGLWFELAPDRVDVLGVIAGATRTETMLAESDNFDTAMDPDEVAIGALDHLGKGPNWVPGEANRAAARGMWPVPRVALINGMSQASAQLFDLPHTPVEGVEFDAD